MIILDFGSGDTCKNDKKQIKDMIDQLADVDRKRECVIKWQLFNDIDGATPLTEDNFDYAYHYATSMKFGVTASVFDEKSCDFLIRNHEIPFVKIACITSKYKFRKHLGLLIPNILWYKRSHALDYDIPTIISIESLKDGARVIHKYGGDYHDTTFLICDPSYPGDIKKYDDILGDNKLENNFLTIEGCRIGISDHTIGLGLYKKYKPNTWEKHYCLDYQTSADKEWSITPQQLKEVLNGS